MMANWETKCQDHVGQSMAITDVSNL